MKEEIELEDGKKPDPILLTPSKLGALIGVTPRTLRNWSKEFGFPGADYGRRQHDLGEVLQWFRGAWQDALAGAPVGEADLKEQLLQAQVRERAAKAGLAEMEEGLRRGDLLRRSDVEARQTAKVRAVRMSWQELPDLVRSLYNRTPAETGDFVEEFLRKVAERYASGEE